MSDRIACPVCGSPNAPGDLFCGTCGSALQSTPPAAASGAGSPAATTLPPPPIPVPSPGPTAPAAPGTVTCANCGTSNPLGRTFCQRCGEELPAGARPAMGAGPGLQAGTGSSRGTTAGPAAGGWAGTQGSGATATVGGGRRPAVLVGSLVAAAFVVLVGVFLVMIVLGGSGGDPGASEASPGESAAPSPSTSPSATASPSLPPEPTPVPPTPRPTPRPTPTRTPTPRPAATPTPATGAAARRVLEDDLLARASFLSCERFRDPDQPFDHGARAAIWCGSPAARVRQVALFTFLGTDAVDDFWTVRLASIEPPPAETEAACTGGLAGWTRWGFGALACYMEGGTARLRWTDDRTAMYGVLDATDADMEALYGWWRTSGRRLGRPPSAAGAPTPTPASAGAGPALGPPSSFVCGSAGATLTDALDRRWRITRVTFRTSGTYERVILHLERTGAGGPGYEPTARAVGVATSELAVEAPGIAPPLSGETAFVVRLGNGVVDSVRLSHYVPNGMRTVTELSTYRLADGTVAAVIGSSGEPCYQLRVPQWRAGATGSPTLADITVDIQR